MWTVNQANFIIGETSCREERVPSIPLTEWKRNQCTLVYMESDWQCYSEGMNSNLSCQVTVTAVSVLNYSRHHDRRRCEKNLPTGSQIILIGAPTLYWWHVCAVLWVFDQFVDSLSNISATVVIRSLHTTYFFKNFKIQEVWIYLGFSNPHWAKNTHSSSNIYIQPDYYLVRCFLVSCTFTRHFW